MRRYQPERTEFPVIIFSYIAQAAAVSSAQLDPRASCWGTLCGGHCVNGEALQAQQLAAARAGFPCLWWWLCHGATRLQPRTRLSPADKARQARMAHATQMGVGIAMSVLIWVELWNYSNWTWSTDIFGSTNQCYLVATS